MSPAEKESSGLRNRTPPVDPRRVQDEPAPASRKTAPAKVPKATPASRLLFGVTRTNLAFLAASLTLSLYAISRYRSLSTLPESYALCSPHGANIFTVDDAKPRAQCLVVHRSHFIDVGTLGARSGAGRCLIRVINARVRRRGHHAMDGFCLCIAQHLACESRRSLRSSGARRGPWLER